MVRPQVTGFDGRRTGRCAALVVAAVVGAAALVGCQPRRPAPAGPPRGAVQATVRVTTADGRLQLTRSSAPVHPGRVPTRGTVVTLDPATRFQTMEGFGAAITGSTAYNLRQMAPADRHRFLVDTFSPTRGLGFSYVRVPIGASDFSLSEYTLDDTPGLEHFALQPEELDYVLPVLRGSWPSTRRSR